MSGVDLHLGAIGDGGKGRSLEAALREAVRSGRLVAGTRLPGTRGLAADLGLSRGTVVAAYTQLVAEGWLVGVPGSGTRVADVPFGVGHGESTTAVSTAPTPPSPPDVDLRPGRPDLSSFPRTAWASSVRRALSAASNDALDYGDDAGLPVLRAALADYVSRTRGVAADAGSVLVTGGFMHALGLLARALGGLGVRAVATEDPGLARHRELITAAGLAAVPLTVGRDGADPGELTSRAGAALLTPAHQHPRGVVLAPDRRAAFVAWARRRDGYLIEDDYDGEFRYDQQPVGAMQALAPDRVVYAGSASKALAPGVRLGWLVVPPALRGPLLEAIAETGTSVPAIDQLALADLIARGDYDRHIRRVRLMYRRRRAELAQRLATVTPTGLDGVAAGLHALLPLASADRERELVDAAARDGIRLHGLHTAGYWHRPGPERPAALIIGYATPPPHAWRRSLDALAAVVGRVAGQTVATRNSSARDGGRSPSARPAK
ncbi:PLP-dependent aminotransferase family protein [Pseudonocardia acaciae]|uniref:MocR-like pyridoxine biosynthesis transcription factor PdxR n=1 Tax=Pseudonocardia acaciae TaxID=551276 RepID=UPI0007E8CFE0|nr:PLP-dependent aminotransferase family protein [Pseudonocardia acaciae]